MQVYKNPRNDYTTSQNLSFPISHKVVYLSIFSDKPFENLPTVQDDNWNDFIIFTSQEYKNPRNDYTTSQNLSFSIYNKVVHLKKFIDSPFENLPTLQDDNWNYFIIFLTQEYKNLRNDFTTSQNLSFRNSHKEVCLSISIDSPFENLPNVQDDYWNNFIIFFIASIQKPSEWLHNFAESVISNFSQGSVLVIIHWFAIWEPHNCTGR